MTFRRTLTAATILTAVLLVAEIIVRSLDGYPLTAPRLPPYPNSAPPPPRVLAPLAATLPLDAETDPTWIDDLPPADPNRPAPDADFLALQRRPRHPKIDEDDLYRAWNVDWLEQHGCDPWMTTRHLPMPLWVFDPPTPGPHQPYRRLPSRTTPLGLTTNRYGWRGPDVPLDKPPGIIRIAFVGASTTVGLHGLPASYPEWVVHWLGRWAQRKGLDVRFDGINAGRSGIRSTDIAAVVADEVLPLEPDLIVYYEGANQFVFTAPLTPAAKSVRQRPLLAALLPYSALAQRAQRAATWIATRGGREADKPDYVLDWPDGVDWHAPNVDDPRLPLTLPVILRDLDTIRAATAAAGGTLVPSSFVWLASDGLRLGGRGQQLIYHWLNEVTWPYTYADVRRLADFQNVVLRRWAASRALPFLDVAAAYPQDPSLFLDAIHMNADGTRVHAWVALQGLLPLIRAELRAGRLPRADRAPLASHPGIGAVRRYVLHCPTSRQARDDAR